MPVQSITPGSGEVVQVRLGGQGKRRDDRSASSEEVTAPGRHFALVHCDTFEHLSRLSTKPKHLLWPLRYRETIESVCVLI